MSLKGAIHDNGLRVSLLAPLTISANIGPLTTTPLTLLAGVKAVTVQASFLYGAGGGTVDAYIQTSLDGGATWLDIMNFHFTTAASIKLSSVTTDVVLAAAVSPGDATLASNTILNGLLGGAIRAKYVSASTVYSGATSLALIAYMKG